MRFSASSKHRSIRDDSVNRVDPSFFDGPSGALRAIRSAIEGYSIDRQAGQPCYTFVLCEAGGMVPQLEAVCEPYSIPVQSAGGFDSVTAKHDLAQEIARLIDRRRVPVRVLHIGDYDPSGEDIFTALSEDVLAFLGSIQVMDREAADQCRFVRVAVTPELIEELDLPTAPAKEGKNRGDETRLARFKGVGDDPTATTQAEAIPPDELARILREAILEEWDEAIEAETLQREEDERERIGNWLNRLPKFGRDPKSGRPWKSFGTEYGRDMVNLFARTCTTVSLSPRRQRRLAFHDARPTASSAEWVCRCRDGARTELGRPCPPG
jgi:hypothetical protein